MKLSTEHEKEYLHRKAQLIMRQHMALTKEIAWMVQQRINLETKLAEIDVELGNAPRPPAPFSRLDTQGRGAE